LNDKFVWCGERAKYGDTAGHYKALKTAFVKESIMCAYVSDVVIFYYRREESAVWRIYSLDEYG